MATEKNNRQTKKNDVAQVNCEPQDLNIPTEEQLSSEDFELVYERFVEEYRRGLNPSIEEYIAQYPSIANDLREILQTFLQIEQISEDNNEESNNETSDVSSFETSNRSSTEESFTSHFSASDYDIELGKIFDRFEKEYRTNQTPSIEEYARLYPEFANDLRKKLPGLLLLEQCGEQYQFSTDVDEGVPKFERLKNFKIIREIGRGGMGVVYEAWDENLDRSVALKVTKVARNKEETIKRFQCEAKIAARLHHTNIVPIFGSDVDGEQFFYVMQLINGYSLEHFLRVQKAQASTGFSGRLIDNSVVNRFRITSWFQRRHNSVEADVTTAVEDTVTSLFPLEHASEPIPSSTQSRNISYPPLQSVHITDPNYYQRVADFGAQAANALEYAHQHDVIHRDIKPSNLVVDQNGTLWITDFGLARTLAGCKTDQRVFSGTLRYMAPEALDGIVSSAADVCSLGLSLYEILTLKPAYPAKDRSKIREQIATGSPLPPRLINHHIPRDLEAIVLKAINKDPEKRYTAGELADDLRRFIEGQSVSARKRPLYEAIWLWSSHNKLLASLIFIVTLLAVSVISLGVGINIISTRKAEEAKKQALLYSHQSLKAFQQIYNSLHPNAHAYQDSLSHFEDSSIVFANSDDLNVSKESVIILDTLVEIYDKLANYHPIQQEDYEVQYQTASILHMHGILLFKQGKIGYYKSLLQSLKYYFNSYQYAESNNDKSKTTNKKIGVIKKRLEIIHKMSGLACLLFDISTLETEELELDGFFNDVSNKMREIRAVAEATNYLSTEDRAHLEREEAQLYIAYVFYKLRSIRKESQDSKSLFSKHESRVPEDLVKLFIESVLHDVDHYLLLQGQPDNQEDFKFYIKVHLAKALWQIVNLNHDEAAHEIDATRQTIESYSEKEPNTLCLEAARIKLIYFESSLAYSRTLQAIENNNKEEEEYYYKEMRNLIDQFLVRSDNYISELNKRVFQQNATSTDLVTSETDDPDQTLRAAHISALTSQVLTFLTFAKREGSLQKFDRIEQLLNYSTQKLETIKNTYPNIDRTSLELRLNSLLARYYVSQSRFEDAHEQIKKSHTLLNEWYEKQQNNSNRIETNASVQEFVSDSETAPNEQVEGALIRLKMFVEEDEKLIKEYEIKIKE